MYELTLLLYPYSRNSYPLVSAVVVILTSFDLAVLTHRLKLSPFVITNQDGTYRSKCSILVYSTELVLKRGTTTALHAVVLVFCGNSAVVAKSTQKGPQRRQEREKILVAVMQSGSSASLCK